MTQIWTPLCNEVSALERKGHGYQGMSGPRCLEVTELGETSRMQKTRAVFCSYEIPRWEIYGDRKWNFACWGGGEGGVMGWGDS